MNLIGVPSGGIPSGKKRQLLQHVGNFAIRSRCPKASLSTWPCGSCVFFQEKKIIESTNAIGIVAKLSSEKHNAQ